MNKLTSLLQTAKNKHCSHLSKAKSDRTYIKDQGYAKDYKSMKYKYIKLEAEIVVRNTFSYCT